MKKLFSIISIVIILAATSGVTISKHYCGNSLTETTYFSDASCSCSTMTEEEENNCCHNEEEIQQFRQDFLVSDFSFNLNNTLIPLFDKIFLLSFNTSLYFEKKNFYINYYPPPPPNRDIPILIQSFLI